MTDPPVPSRFICPITQEIMKVPVMDREGHNFEKAAIETWLLRSHKCPVGREAISPQLLFRNRALQEEIEEWRCGSCGPVAHVVSDGTQAMAAADAPVLSHVEGHGEVDHEEATASNGTTHLGPAREPLPAEGTPSRPVAQPQPGPSGGRRHQGRLSAGSVPADGPMHRSVHSLSGPLLDFASLDHRPTPCSSTGRIANLREGTAAEHGPVHCQPGPVAVELGAPMQTAGAAQEPRPWGKIVFVAGCVFPPIWCAGLLLLASKRASQRRFACASLLCFSIEAIVIAVVMIVVWPSFSFWQPVYPKHEKPPDSPMPPPSPRPPPSPPPLIPPGYYDTYLRCAAGFFNMTHCLVIGCGHCLTNPTTHRCTTRELCAASAFKDTAREICRSAESLVDCLLLSPLCSWNVNRCVPRPPDSVAFLSPSPHPYPSPSPAELGSSPWPSTHPSQSPSWTSSPPSQSPSPSQPDSAPRPYPSRSPFSPVASERPSSASPEADT